MSRAATNQAVSARERQAIIWLVFWVKHLNLQANGPIQPHLVRCDADAVRGASALVTRLFTDAELERGQELRLQLISADGLWPDQPGSVERYLAGLPIATAALFGLDERLFVLDVIPASASDVSTAAPARSVYRMVTNAILNLALETGRTLVYFPSRASLGPHGAVPYEMVQSWYGARLRRTLFKERLWRVESQNSPLVPLDAAPLSAPRPAFALLHSFEGPSGRAREDGRTLRTLRAVLAIARAQSVPLTLCLPVSTYEAAEPLLVGVPSLSVALHAAGELGKLLCALPGLRSRAVDARGLYTARGASVPQSAERTLRHFGFTWVIEAASHASRSCTDSAHPVVRLPVAYDDAGVSERSAAEWLEALEEVAAQTRHCLVEFSGDRSELWLPAYENVIQQLRQRRPLLSCDEVAIDIRRVSTENVLRPERTATLRAVPAAVEMRIHEERR